MSTRVSSNGVAVRLDDGAELPDSSALLDDPAALRARLARDGCLLLRGLVDAVDVLALRRAYLDSFPLGTVDADGVVTVADLPPYGVRGHPAHAFVRSSRFARFVDTPRLSRLAGVLLDGPVRRLPRTILRHFQPGSNSSSRAHLDFDYMDRGSDRMVTMWLPIGDCPVATGGLVYLERSHTIDPARLAPLRAVTDRPHDSRPLSHDLAWVARRLDRRWLWADYRAGDVAVHTPRTVHAALDTTSRAARMSVDVRFVHAHDRADPRMLRPWAADDGA